MFELEDLRKTRVWEEARDEGQTLAKRELVRKWLARGMAIKEIAALLEISTQKVRRLAKDAAT